MKRASIVYLPVEIRSREFDSKALVAAMLARRGYSVLLGEQWTLYTNLARMPAGAVLFKAFTNLHRVAMREARDFHHAVYVLEEELMAHTVRKAIATFCSPEIFDLPDVIFSTSDFEKQVLVEGGGNARKIEVTGNPRVDILKPEFHGFYKREIEIIHKHFGEFVLVNTNFAITNSIWVGEGDVKRIFIEAGFLRLDDPESVREWEDKIVFEEANKAAIIAAIRDLAARRPNLKVVVRPHPSEGLFRWEGVFDAFANVSIAREGPHVPWTLAAKILLHTSCTTGFEAEVAGKVAMSLVPRPCWISDSFISNRVNPAFAEPTEMINAVEAYLDRGEVPGKAPTSLSRAEAAHYVWNVGDKSSAQRIAGLLTKVLPSPRGRVPLPRLEMYERGQNQKKKMNVGLEECRDVFARILGIIGKGKPIGVDQVGDSLFYITPADA